ncbi:MAG: alpha/beta fold hydrolase [Alphaproteobacteria bacterium]
MGKHSIGMRYVEANGLRQLVRFAGHPDAPTVLLIHGLGWDSTLWLDQMQTLAAADWRVVAPDLRGMGATGSPAAPYSIHGYAADVAALLDALRIGRTAVVGFSLGGMIAMALASAAPDRIGAAVFACCAAASTDADRAATEAMLERAEAMGAQKFAEEQALAIWHPDWARAHPERIAAFVGWRAAMDQPALFRGFRAAYGVDLRPRLSRIRVPCRVIVADQDVFLPVEAGEEIADRLPDADCVIVRGAGHMVPIEQPESFDIALRGFLDAYWPAMSAPAAGAAI